MAFLVLLSDRTARDALPALAGLGIDVKLEPLSLTSVEHVAALLPEAVLVDAAENPAQGFGILTGMRAREARLPLVAVVERPDLERFAWEQAADELVYPGTPESELRVRLAMLRRRTNAGEGTAVRLGPLVLDVESYRAVLAGRSLDLTYKEFELLRFLASRPGRVSTRPSLLREVWGYDFYGGTRTVDVHIRRLRSKLGPEHEWLIETVRGVGYRAADPAARGEPSDA